jgi:hypothetical protein
MVQFLLNISYFISTLHIENGEIEFLVHMEFMVGGLKKKETLAAESLIFAAFHWQW